MEFKSFASDLSAVEDRTVTGIAAVIGNVDDSGDMIMPGAFNKTLQENIKRIRHLWQHDSSSPPVAVIKRVREVSRKSLPQSLLDAFPEAQGGLEVEREYLDTPRGNEILQGIAKGAISEMSFGYDVIKAKINQKSSIRELHEVRLWDISDVNWGMNPATMAVKTAVPYKDTGKAPEDTPWEAPNLGDFTDMTFADLDGAEKRRIMAHFAFSAEIPPETYGSLKLPHHQAARSGVGRVVWNGVRAAMGALMGARGGVDIPEADRRAVYDHLAKHYAEFNKTPPDYKYIVLSSAVKAIMTSDTPLELGLPEWRLSKQRIEGYMLGLQAINDLLTEAEPLISGPDQHSLDEMLLRLEIAKRELLLYGGGL